MSKDGNINDSGSIQSGRKHGNFNYLKNYDKAFKKDKKDGDIGSDDDNSDNNITDLPGNKYKPGY